MKTTEIKLRKLLRKIFGGISFTAMAFVFQSCYGTIPEEIEDVKLTGTVKSKTTSLPIEGIIVTVNSEGYYRGITDKDGKFDFYAGVPMQDVYSDRENITGTRDKVTVQFLDVDGMDNGLFADKTIIVSTANKNEININIELEEKQ